MDFLKNKTVRLIASILFVVSVLALMLGGIAPESLVDMVTKLVAFLAAVVDVVAAIIEWLEK